MTKLEELKAAYAAYDAAVYVASASWDAANAAYDAAYTAYKAELKKQGEKEND